MRGVIPVMKQIDCGIGLTEEATFVTIKRKEGQESYSGGVGQRKEGESSVIKRWNESQSVVGWETVLDAGCGSLGGKVPPMNTIHQEREEAHESHEVVSLFARSSSGFDRLPSRQSHRAKRRRSDASSGQHGAVGT